MRGGNDVVPHIDLMLQHHGVGASLRQYISTDPHIADGSVLVGVADPELFALTVIVESASRKKIVPGWVGDVFVDRSVWTGGYDNPFLIVAVIVQCQQECCLLVAAQW